MTENMVDMLEVGNLAGAEPEDEGDEEGEQLRERKDCIGEHYSAV